MFTNNFFVPVVASFFILAGCQTMDPYTGQQKTSKTAVYSGVGALGGALLGALANGSDGALAGAALGAGLGAGTGYYQDQQEAALRQKLQATGVSVQRNGANINLVMPGNITFESGSSNLSSDFYPVLGSVADIFAEYNKNSIIVVGHTDSTGVPEKNQTLSELRANSVAMYLPGQGVNQARLSIAGRGQDEPVADNGTQQGRAQNRRVEIVLLPPPASQ